MTPDIYALADTHKAALAVKVTAEAEYRAAQQCLAGVVGNEVRTRAALMDALSAHLGIELRWPGQHRT